MEEALARELPEAKEVGTEKYRTRVNNKYTLQMLEERQGNYPLTTFLEAEGLADSESFLLYHPLYLDALSKLYTEAKVEDIKAYLMVHTVLKAMALLDEDSVAMA